MDFIFVKTRIMWCLNPTNINSLGSGFGLQIYLLVGFLTVYRFSFKHSLNNPATSILVISCPKTLSFLDLVPYHLLYISLSSFVLPLLCLISSFPHTSYSFLLFSSNSLTNPHLSALTPFI